MSYPFKLKDVQGNLYDLEAEAYGFDEMRYVGIQCIKAVRESLGRLNLAEADIESFQYEWEGTKYDIPWVASKPVAK